MKSRIVQSDCKKIAVKLMDVDLIYADILYDKWDEVPYLEFVDCLRFGGAMFIQTDQRSVADIVMQMRTVPQMDLINVIIWSYDWGGRSKNAFGKKHDDILYYAKIGGERTFNAEAVALPKVALINSIKAWKIPTDVWQGNFYTTSPERIKDPRTGKGYIWQKPEWLLERIIKATTNKGDSVFEPYLGTGTACAVAKRLGRKYVGCDTSKHMVDVAKHRLENQ